MKAILINPTYRMVQEIQIKEGNDLEALQELYRLVGEEALDAAHIMPGEAIYLGDHSALQDPPLASYTVEGYRHPLYGPGVLIGHDKLGKERETKLTVDDLWELITWLS